MANNLQVLFITHRVGLQHCLLFSIRVQLHVCQLYLSSDDVNGNDDESVDDDDDDDASDVDADDSPSYSILKIEP